MRVRFSIHSRCEDEDAERECFISHENNARSSQGVNSEIPYSSACARVHVATN
jgi:hypothetical protein